MALRHLVFADCADACPTDPNLQDVFVGLAYGLLPLCVSYDGPRDALVFRRALLPTDKDKAQRLATAADELQADPAVAEYNAGEPAGPGPLHVDAATLSVAWAVGVHAVETHVRVVPALLRWTRWERDSPWQTLRAGLATGAGGPLLCGTLRHVRLAQVLEWVVQRAGPATPDEVSALCQQTATAFLSGHLQVNVDPATGDVVDVSGP